MARKTVLASGVFDLIHYAHIRFLEEAKKAGGKNAYLVVIVARDKTAEKLKGKKPVIPEDHRRAIVESMKPVDEAILGYENVSFTETIKKLKPNIIAVGYDQKSIEEEVRKTIDAEKIDINVVRIGRFGPTDLDSSSKIKRKILNEKNNGLLLKCLFIF
ncbi:MAG: adenylyltransferase/cytidyltransferase family protein [Candidatus Bathyarchaeota archaeon]